MTQEEAINFLKTHVEWLEENAIWLKDNWELTLKEGRGYPDKFKTAIKVLIGGHLNIHDSEILREGILNGKTR